MRGTEWEDASQPNPLWPSLPISADEHKELCAPWRKMLIIKVLGKSVGFNFLWNRLKQIWRLEEDFSLVDLGNDFFLVRVHNPDDYNFIISESHWIVAGHYLTVKKWKPLFYPNQESIGTTAVWVRLPGLPLELFNRKILVDAGNLFRKTVKIDKPTEESSIGKYARICVEVQLDKPLIGGLMIGPIWQKIEYKGLDEICFACGVYGHKAEGCPVKVRTEKIVEVSEESPAKAMTKAMQETAILTDELEARFGPWMLAERRSRKHGKKDFSSMENRTQEMTGSRFNPLADVEEEKWDMNRKDLEGKNHMKNPGLQGGSTLSRLTMTHPKASLGKGKAKVLNDITNLKTSKEKSPSSGRIKFVEKEKPQKTHLSSLGTLHTLEGSASKSQPLAPKPAQPIPSTPSCRSSSSHYFSPCQILHGVLESDGGPIALVDSANLSHMDWSESNVPCEVLQVANFNLQSRVHEIETDPHVDPMMGGNTPMIVSNEDGDMEGIC
ncbi:hypothetical protein REPUB_Repub09cG0139700 [Reevesia pubescens]